MKKIYVSSANDCAELEGLIFFTQVLDELLFHHTIDSFKAPALNSISRILELKALAQQAILLNKGTRSLTPVLDELEWSIKNDPVITGDATTIAYDLVKKIRGSEKPTKEVLYLVDTLFLHFNNYWSDLTAAIKNTISDGRQKEKLQGLATTLSCQIELWGFSRQFAYFSAQNMLIKKLHAVEKLDPQKTISEFMDLFDSEDKNWKVIYRGGKEFLQYSPLAENYGMIIKDTYLADTAYPARVRGFLGQSSDYPSFIIFDDISSKDCYSARNSSETLIELFRSAYQFHLHDHQLIVNGICVAINEDTGECFLLKPIPNPMTCAVERLKPELDAELQNTTELLAGKHLTQNSTRMFHNALEYHKAALATEIPENQLLDLWAALEGFLPQPDGNGTRFSHYSGLLIPTLTLTYPEKIFRYISNSLYHGGNDVRKFVESSQLEGDFFSKSVCLITAEDQLEQRKKLLELIHIHPLLRFRIDRSYRAFQSKKCVLETLLAHKQKISWHLHRIYTTRNHIIHSAESLPYLRTLVENLHAYMDTLIPSITKLAVASPRKIDIEAAVKLLSMHEEFFLSTLRKKEEKCTTENYRSIIFGAQNPLGPFNQK